MDIKEAAAATAEQSKVRARKLAADITELVTKLDVQLVDEPVAHEADSLLAEQVALLIGRTVGRTFSSESEKIVRYISLARQLDGVALEAAVLGEV